MDISTRIYAKK